MSDIIKGILSVGVWAFLFWSAWYISPFVPALIIIVDFILLGLGRMLGIYNPKGTHRTRYW